MNEVIELCGSAVVLPQPYIEDTAPKTYSTSLMHCSQLSSGVPLSRPTQECSPSRTGVHKGDMRAR